ncbi:hypothetical protein F511_14382 [Dorcoceras hygrometricum]|uniref:Uncharacterized protein n=1 Tax=Dorcoceras hygrometricum TaxID=472368 RepID=A0A2Z7A3G3_9LAMI|nr:hypothetical protein F511_14382 [Dorcoceras hygrometricum]
MDGAAERKRKRAVKEEEEEPPPPPQPTEEEVDEFFAILKRMRVAVKYFKNVGASSSNVSPVLAAAGEAGGRKAERRGLDLNSVPDSESNS